MLSRGPAMAYSLNDQGQPLWKGQPLQLTPKESALLGLLSLNYPGAVSRDELVEKVWRGASASDESIARCISRLRHAVPDIQIAAVYGFGYRLVDRAPGGDARLLTTASAPPRPRCPTPRPSPSP